ncbi:MAG TPA: O-antigen ligase family protein [Steroidobacteraceae bacterium]|nr:O-antigen ligase family protein [Steroidobacteraceae bacterium]
MFAIAFFLVCLIIAPQLWIPPFVGLPTDFIAYPLLMLAVALGGRITQALKFGTIEWLMFAFVAWTIISSVFNGFSGSSVLFAVFYFKAFLLFKLTLAIMEGDLARVRSFVRIFSALTLILAVEVLFHRFSADGRGWAGQSFSWIDPSVLEAGGKGRARWIGIFDGPGVFCVLFTFVVPFVLVRTAKGYAFTTRLVAASILGLMLVVTFFIGSRGGMVATLAIFGLYFLVKSKLSLRAMIGCGALGMGVLMFAPSYLTTVRDSQNSTQYRVEMWAEGLEMMKQNPVFGIGRGNFKAYTSKLIAHNSFIEIGGETGLVGLFIYMALVYLCLKSCLHARDQLPDQHNKDFALAATLALVGYLISSMFVTLEYETFYLLLAMSAALGRCVPEPLPITQRDFKIVGISVFAFLLGMQIFVIFYLG